MIGALARRLFARRDVVLYARALYPSEVVDGPAGYAFAELSRADLDGCALAAQRGRMARFEWRIEQGYRCAGFRDSQGQVVSYIWIAQGREGPSSVAIWRDVRISLVADDVFFWDCRTAPEHEGRGLYRSALRLAADRLATSGSRRAWIETEPGNLASRRGITGAGFAPAADLTIVEFAGMRWLRDAADRHWRRLPAPLRLGEDVAARQGSAAIMA